MSKIGKKAITLPQGVTVTVVEDEIIVKGPKGELKSKVMPKIGLKQEDGEVIVTRKNDEAQTKAFHGLVRSLIANNIVGVTDAYKKTLKLIGTGYRVQTKGAGLSVTVGFSHPVDIAAIEGIKLSIEGNDIIHIEGIDKQKVGQAAADIRSIRPPEPYKGKGIRYIDEVVRKKAGKTATA